MVVELFINGYVGMVNQMFVGAAKHSLVRMTGNTNVLPSQYRGNWSSDSRRLIPLEVLSLDTP